MPLKFSPQIEELYSIFENEKFLECDGCSLCCYFPWLLREEYDPHLEVFGKDIKDIEGVAFILDESRCKYAVNNRCGLYSDRPLDCRLFPLDIIEVDDEYWWCIFTICPKHEDIKKKLIPLIPKLENSITAEMFEQYKKQISITKKIYLPYKLKKYQLVRKFNSNLY